MPRSPIWVYDNYTAYTEFADLDDTRLTEEFALRQLDAVERAIRLGVRIDYYLMNAFWYEPDGRYRSWRQPDWPDGPDTWLRRCAEIGVLPGLWLGTNSLWKLVETPEWAASLDPRSDPMANLVNGKPFGMNGRLSMSEGPFLDDLVAAMQLWYDRGVRLFEFDVADFDAATASQQAGSSEAEIRERNIAAFVGALEDFRARNPEVAFAGFNGFGGEIGTTSSPVPFEQPVDPRFLGVLGGIYTGDVRMGDVPHTSPWRAMDIYTDHMTRRYEANGVPLHQTDPFGFVMSTTWFGGHRGRTEFRSMALLLAARNDGRKKLFGDLGRMTEDDARFLARIQGLYQPLYETGSTGSFGGMPGEIAPYGWVSRDGGDALVTVVNPAQEFREVPLSPIDPGSPTRVLFSDSGFRPTVADGVVTLGPGQLALVGAGRFADAAHDLGVEPDVVIPRTIEPLAIRDVVREHGSIAAVIDPPAGEVRIVATQRGEDGWAVRSMEYEPGIAVRIGEPELGGPAFTVTATVDGVPLDVRRAETLSDLYGISWVLAEVTATGDPVALTVTTRHAGPVELSLECYAIEYGRHEDGTDAR